MPPAGVVEPLARVGEDGTVVGAEPTGDAVLPGVALAWPGVALGPEGVDAGGVSVGFGRATTAVDVDCMLDAMLIAVPIQRTIVPQAAIAAMVATSVKLRCRFRVLGRRVIAPESRGLKG